MTETAAPPRGAVQSPGTTGGAPVDRDALDRAVATVADRAGDWGALGLRGRITLLDQALRETAGVVEDWAAAARRAKGIAPGTPAEGEDLATGPLILLRHLRMLRDTLTDLDQHGEIRLPGDPFLRPDGRLVVPVFPTGPVDRVLTPGHTGEVWMPPHVGLDGLRIGETYREPAEPGVCLVLGAGNIPSIGPSDCLTKLFNHDQVCVLKMNPVNAHMGPYVEQAMAPFVREGYLRVVYGGAGAGQHLTGHDAVGSVHMTGSDKTHDAVVFGPGEAGERRRAAGERLLDKPVTSELGNVTPIIVVPGPWSDADIAYQAKHIVSMLTNNAGFNCAAARMIVTHPRWRRRDDLLDAIRTCLADAPQRDAYYPGARDRWELFTAEHPEAETFGSAAPGEVPWTFVPDLDEHATDDIMFTVEPFNGTFGEVPVDAPTDVPGWLRRAVEFCNDTLWGTLAATLLVHPRSPRDAAVAAAVDRAVADLEYGSIGVNTWAATSYGMVSTTWGAFPGHPDTDIQSGRGVVHNTLMIEEPQKSVVRAPWRLGTKPPMAYDHRTMASLARRLIAVEGSRDWTQLPGIVWDGLRA